MIALSVIVISSELPEILALADRVVVLHEGHVLAFGGVADVTRGAGAATIIEAFTTLTGKDGT